MALEFKFPDVGEGVHEGTLVKWIIKEGEKVEADQNFAEVETDKAVVEIPSPRSGVILKTFHKEGDNVTVGEVLAVIGDEGEEVPDSSSTESPAEEKKEGETEHYTGSIVGFVPDESTDLDEQRKQRNDNGNNGGAGNKVQASPRTRKLAKDLGVDLASISGSGPNGRVTDEDVTAAAKGGNAGGQETATKPVEKKAKVTKKYDFFGYVDRKPIKGIRKVIAEKMSEVTSTYALVTNHDSVDMSAVAKVREEDKKNAPDGVKVSFMPYIVKAVVAALKNHPIIGSCIEEDEILIKKYYNIGIAVDTPEGLMVPVVKGADKKDVYEISSLISGYAAKAQDKKLDIMDMKGGVFTISNIGAVGATTYFTPIPNHPESCILGCGKMGDVARIVDGKVETRRVMPISFTYDHRVVDGGDAARFMADLIDFLEHPEKMKEE